MMQRVFLSLICSFLLAATARAQRGTPVVVRIQLKDSLGAPIPGVSVVLLRDSTDAVLFSMSDSAGRSGFTFDEDESSSYSVSTRKVGYTATERTLDKFRKDTISLALVLARVGTLDTVRVTERALPLVRQPYIGAAEIAADKRSILSLRDAVGKLRPELGFQTHKCVADPEPRAQMAPIIPISHGYVPIPITARVYVNGRRIPRMWDPWNSIHAEHIQEIRFVNCLDSSIPGLPEKAWPSVYVLLKPGYAWDLRDGSHLVEP
jgi:hypothetical protein